MRGDEAMTPPPTMHEHSREGDAPAEINERTKMPVETVKWIIAGAVAMSGWVTMLSAKVTQHEAVDDVRRTAVDARLLANETRIKEQGEHMVSLIQAFTESNKAQSDALKQLADMTKLALNQNRRAEAKATP